MSVVNKKIESIIAKYPKLDMFPNWCSHNGDLRLDFHISLHEEPNTVRELNAVLTMVDHFVGALYANKRVNSVVESKFDTSCNEIRFIISTDPTSCDVEEYKAEELRRNEYAGGVRKQVLQKQLAAITAELAELDDQT